MTAHAKFPSPYDLKTPVGAEGWEKLYPYYLQFQNSLRDKEDGKFWFCDSQHWPSPFKPFDAVTVEFAVKCLGQYNTRHYLIPPANGVEYRIHNGYCYMSPVAVAPELIGATFLVDGVATTDLATRLPPGGLVDVLPPFAGG